jgi:uncharacterized membrane protein YuzA (DUF378 family)
MVSVEQVITYVVLALVLVGALNWGVHAVNPDFNVVKLLSMKNEMVEKSVYGLVALAAVVVVVQMVRKTVCVHEKPDENKNK